MNLFILLKSALSLNIGLYRIFIAMPTHSIDIVTFGPKLSSPKLLFHLRMKFENLFGRDAFDRFDDLGRTHRWYALYQKMNMVLVRPYFNELDLIPLRNLKTDFFQTLIDRFGDNNPPIFGRTHEVVEKD